MKFWLIDETEIEEFDASERPVDPPDPAPSGGTVVWLFGRGLSMECGLTWTEPEEWKTQFQRLERIERIKQALRAEMARVDSAPIREFLILAFIYLPNTAYGGRLEDARRVQW